jgi:ubiquinone/menaquinone biosynthesis C-methylase UbiE
MGLQFGPFVPPVYPDPLRESHRRPRRNPANRLNLEQGMKVLIIGPDPEQFVEEAVQRVGDSGQVAVVAGRQETADRLEAKWHETARDRVTVYVAQADDLPLPDDSLDRVIAARMPGAAGHRQRVLQELRRVLKPGGLLGVEQRLSDQVLAGPRTVRRWCTEAGFDLVWQYGNPLHYLLVFWARPRTGEGAQDPGSP